MNNFLLDILTYISTNIPELAIDVNLFMLQKPTSPDCLVAVTEYAGTGTAIFSTTSVRSVQFTIRDTSNITASELAWKIYKLMVPPNQLLDLGEGRISIVSPRNTPYKLKTDQQGRHEWIINLGITYNNNY